MIYLRRSARHFLLFPMLNIKNEYTYISSNDGGPDPSRRNRTPGFELFWTFITNAREMQKSFNGNAKKPSMDTTTETSTRQALMKLQNEKYDEI